MVRHMKDGRVSMASHALIRRAGLPGASVPEILGALHMQPNFA